MLASSSVQRIERLAGFGAMRDGPVQYVLTSLKEAAQSNIIGLTDVETWTDAAAFAAHHPSCVSSSLATGAVLALRLTIGLVVNGDDKTKAMAEAAAAAFRAKAASGNGSSEAPGAVAVRFQPVASKVGPILAAIHTIAALPTFRAAAALQDGTCAAADLVLACCELTELFAADDIIVRAARSLLATALAALVFAIRAASAGGASDPALQLLLNPVAPLAQRLRAKLAPSSSTAVTGGDATEAVAPSALVLHLARLDGGRALAVELLAAVVATPGARTAVYCGWDEAKMAKAKASAQEAAALKRILATPTKALSSGAAVDSCQLIGISFAAFCSSPAVLEYQNAQKRAAAKVEMRGATAAALAAAPVSGEDPDSNIAVALLDMSMDAIAGIVQLAVNGSAADIPGVARRTLLQVWFTELSEMVSAACDAGAISISDDARFNQRRAMARIMRIVRRHLDWLIATETINSADAATHNHDDSTTAQVLSAVAAGVSHRRVLAAAVPALCRTVGALGQVAPSVLTDLVAPVAQLLAALPLAAGDSSSTTTTAAAAELIAQSLDHLGRMNQLDGFLRQLRERIMLAAAHADENKDQSSSPSALQVVLEAPAVLGALTMAARRSLDNEGLLEFVADVATGAVAVEGAAGMEATAILLRLATAAVRGILVNPMTALAVIEQLAVSDSIISAALSQSDVSGVITSPSAGADGEPISRAVLIFAYRALELLNQIRATVWLTIQDAGVGAIDALVASLARTVWMGDAAETDIIAPSLQIAPKHLQRFFDVCAERLDGVPSLALPLAAFRLDFACAADISNECSSSASAAVPLASAVLALVKIQLRRDANAPILLSVATAANCARLCPSECCDLAKRFVEPLSPCGAAIVAPCDAITVATAPALRGFLRLRGSTITIDAASLCENVTEGEDALAALLADHLRVGSADATALVQSEAYDAVWSAALKTIKRDADAAACWWELVDLGLVPLRKRERHADAGAPSPAEARWRKFAKFVDASGADDSTARVLQSTAHRLFTRVRRLPETQQRCVTLAVLRFAVRAKAFDLLATFAPVAATLTNEERQAVAADLVASAKTSADLADSLLWCAAACATTVVPSNSLDCPALSHWHYLPMLITFTATVAPDVAAELVAHLSLQLDVAFDEANDVALCHAAQAVGLALTRCRQVMPAVLRARLPQRLASFSACGGSSIALMRHVLRYLAAPLRALHEQADSVLPQITLVLCALRSNAASTLAPLVMQLIMVWAKDFAQTAVRFAVPYIGAIVDGLTTAALRAGTDTEVLLSRLDNATRALLTKKVIVDASAGRLAAGCASIGFFTALGRDNAAHNTTASAPLAHDILRASNPELLNVTFASLFRDPAARTSLKHFALVREESLLTREGV